MKAFIFLIGISLLGIVIFTGYYTKSHSNFVIWFGLVTAILMPFAIEALVYPFRSNDKDKKLMRALSTVPEIHKLIEEANDKTSQIKALKKQQDELENLIAYESRRRTLIVEREIYLFQGRTALEGINKVNRQLEHLATEAMAFPDELKELLELVKEEEPDAISLKIGTKELSLKKAHFQGISIYGNLAFEMIRALAELFSKIR